jgi:hypothetical protein
VNIQGYLIGFPSFISDKIEYDDSNTLEETIRHAKCLYDQQGEQWRGFQEHGKSEMLCMS